MVYKRLSTNSFMYRSWLGVCLFLTVACGPATTTNAPIPPQPTCIPSSSEANPYNSHEISPSVSGIYINRFNNLGAARQDALSQLGRNTEHWSDQVNVAIDDFQMARIVVTYLDPVLIQYVVLNYVLNDPHALVDPAPNFFDNEIYGIMSELGGRNEMLFIITITSPFYRELAYNENVLNIRIPIEQMALISSADIRVIPTHEDHILDENIDITHGPISGIVGYPLAIMSQEQCVWIIDQWTNSLTLDVPWVTFGGNEFKNRFWNIPYHPLVMESNDHVISTNNSIDDQNPLTSLKAPPTPYWQPNAQFDNTDKTVYWQEMGRYIWNVVITASHH